MNPVPVPRDIPLPLPASSGLLEFLLVAAFIAHIVFVNLMVGGSILVLVFEFRGRKRPDFDKLAKLLATTVTVNKSLAVVLGVAPLLLINVLYTIHFYTANALTGTAWIMLVPAIAAAFLLLYLHKYTWERLSEQKLLHLSILGLAVALFLMIPLVFLANINLMLFPERWAGVSGFLSALALPNVFPRYFHFLCASLILTSLFGTWYFGRPRFDVEANFQALSKPGIRRIFLSIAFAVSLVQFVVGPLVLFTLPAKGLNGAVVLTVLIGAFVAIPAVWMMWKEISAPETTGRRLPYIVAHLGVTVVCMAFGRHMYREVALSSHKAEMKETTERWLDDSAQAAYDLEVGLERVASGVSEGQAVFETNCAACHGLDKRIVGPALTEIAEIYENDPDGIVTWARAPGKKRADAPQMPAFASLGDAKLRAVAEYMLQLGGGKS